MRQKQHTCPICGGQWTDRGRVQPRVTTYEFAAPQRFGQSVAIPQLPTSPPVSGGTQTATEYHRWEMNDIGVALCLAGVTGALISSAFVATILAFRAEGWVDWLAWPIAGMLDIASLVFLAKTWTFLRDDLAILKVAKSERPAPPMPQPAPIQNPMPYRVRADLNIPSLSGEAITRETVDGVSTVAQSSKDGKMHKAYLDFGISHPLRWHQFCRSVSLGGNFSGRHAAKFDIDNEGSEWHEIVRQFATRGLLEDAGKDRTKPTLNEFGEQAIDLFANTPPLLG